MIQIINYGAGNIRSVSNALEKLVIDYEVISSVKELNADAKLIFPGVGAAGSAMQNLKISGFDKALKNWRGPFLGICLGMQLLMDSSKENDCNCLSIIPGSVEKFGNSFKVPQIGWNKVLGTTDPLFSELNEENYFYFVNSYRVVTDDQYVLGQCFYGECFPAAVRRENFYGVQFHPEKSGEPGLKLLSNFCNLC